jgi:hypothetical protein
MRLEGSCHCGAVGFSLESETARPYMHCYCTICRKTAGGGGYAINLGGRAETLQVSGEEDLGVYRAVLEPGGDPSPARRHFCKRCGSALWVFDPRWPELIHPFASAIDTALPVPPERVHIMLDHKANWVMVPEGPADPNFAQYPDQSLADWHAEPGRATP